MQQTIQAFVYDFRAVKVKSTEFAKFAGGTFNRLKVHCSYYLPVKKKTISMTFTALCVLRYGAKYHQKKNGTIGWLKAKHAYSITDACSIPI